MTTRRPSHTAITWTFLVMKDRLYDFERSRGVKLVCGRVTAQTHFAARHRASALSGVSPEHLEVQEMPRYRRSVAGDWELAA